MTNQIESAKRLSVQFSRILRSPQLLHVLDSFPEGNQQRRQILFFQRQQKIHIPVRLKKFQKLFMNFSLCQFAHVYGGYPLLNIHGFSQYR